MGQCYHWVLDCECRRQEVQRRGRRCEDRSRGRCDVAAGSRVDRQARSSRMRAASGSRKGQDFKFCRGVSRRDAVPLTPLFLFHKVHVRTLSSRIEKDTSVLFRPTVFAATGDSSAFPSAVTTTHPVTFPDSPCVTSSPCKESLYWVMRR